MCVLLFCATMTTFSQILFIPEGPGGVTSNLTHWLKANAGTGTTVENAVVDTWTNQANPVINATRAGVSDNAVYQSNVLNFNPVVNFINGDNGYFDMDLDVTTDSNYNIIGIVQRTDSNSKNYFVGTTSTTPGQGFHLGYREDNQATIDHYLFTVNRSFVNNYDAGGISVAMLRGQLSNSTGMTIEESRDGVFKTFTNPVNTGYLKGFSPGVIGRGFDDDGFVGHVAEIIIYNRSLNSLDLQKIYSYLAIKYGMTMDVTDGITNGNYVINNGGTTVWNAATMAPYHNNVIGVVKDTKSALEQLKSKSEHSGDILTIDATATTSFDDLDYIMLGTDKGSLETTSAGKHPGYVSRIKRTWKVSTNNVAGDIGSVDISIDIKGLIPDTGIFTDYALLVDSTDTDFSDASTYTSGTLATNPVTGVTTLNFTGVTLENNNIISLATIAATSFKGPGGVTENMTHWLRADDGLSSTTDGDALSQWDNQRRENHATRTITGLDDPFYVETRHNFNPSVYFPNGDNGVFDLDLEQIKGGSYNLITILERNNGNFENYILGTQRTDFTPAKHHALHFGYRENYLVTLDQYTSNIDITTTNFDNPQTVALLRGNVDTTKGKYIYELRNKQVTTGSNDEKNPLGGTGSGLLGRGFKRSTGFEGYASEVIIYNDNLSVVDVTKIYSYLAVKYGLTLERGTDYLASNNKVIWDAALNDEFYDNIGGIGRDDSSDLNQKQSISSNTNALLTVALGTTIETRNIDNINTFDDDLDYLIWGTRTTTPTFTTICGLTIPKIDRDWKIQNTGGVDKITLQFDMTGIPDANKYVLLKDVDGDFSTFLDQTTINSGVFSSDKLTFSNISLDDGIVFTLIPIIEYDIVYNGTVWSGGSGVGNQPGVGDYGKTVLIEENVTVTEDSNCECINVEAGKVLTVPTDRVVNTNTLVLNGDIYLEGIAEFVQTTPFNINSGTGKVYKIIGEAASSMFRYNYFSSPVNTSGNFSLKENLKLNTGATLADNISPVYTNSYDEPGKISRRWIHTFNNDLAFKEVNENEIMPTGVGFTMKGTSTVNKYNFIGSPNNGDVNVPLTKDNFLLTGNPYTSTIDAVTFNNLNGPSGTNVTDGVVYLWDQPSVTKHYNAITDNSGGYATVTSTIAVSAATLEDETTIVPGATIPTTYIKPGQGFIVYGDNTGNVLFNNSLRSGVDRTANRFYKTKSLKKITPTVRLGFEYEHEDGRVYHRQIASALDGGTMKKDLGKDAFMLDYYTNDAYWVLPNDADRYIITSVPRVNDDLELPIGVVLDKKREITFKLDEVKSISEDIYLLDKAENKLVNITNSSHNVIVPAGEYIDRFSLVFKKQQTSDYKSKTTIRVTKSNIDIFLEKGNIKAVELYSFNGKKVLSHKELSNTHSLEISTKGISTNMYILKVFTDSSSITKKVFIE